MNFHGDGMPTETSLRMAEANVTAMRDFSSPGFDLSADAL
jgi:hypothetical protein